MKKNTIIGISLAVVAMILMILLAIYLTIQFKDEVFSPDSGSKIESEADAVLAALNQPVTEAPKQTEAKAAAEKSENKAETVTEKTEETVAVSSAPFMIWVGDSRTVGMGRAVNNDHLFIGADGEGYEWFNETGVTDLCKAISEHTDAPVVYNFGVNDCANIDNYLSIYQAMEQEYPDTHFYYVSVYPIEPTLCENITNEEITAFNAKLSSTFPDSYIDTFTFLMINQAVTLDGIHYSQNDYRNIFNFVTKQIEFKENAA